jgi:hypothetical protein
MNHREDCGVCHRSPCVCKGDSFVFPGGPDMASMDQMSTSPADPEDPYVGLAREYNAVCDKLTAATARASVLEREAGAWERHCKRIAEMGRVDVRICSVISDEEFAGWECAVGAILSVPPMGYPNEYQQPVIQARSEPTAPDGVPLSRKRAAVARYEQLTALVAQRDTELAAMGERVALYRKGYEARGKILAAYRTGSRPSEKALLDSAEVANALALIAPEGKGSP